MSPRCAYTAQGSYECDRGNKAPPNTTTSTRELFRLSPYNDRTLTGAQNEYMSQFSASQAWAGAQADRDSSVQQFEAIASGSVSSHDRTVATLENNMRNADVGADAAVALYHL
jgi:hypothetical protein